MNEGRVNVQSLAEDTSCGIESLVVDNCPELQLIASAVAVEASNAVVRDRRQSRVEYRHTGRDMLHTLDRDRNTAIFRIFQETLTNVARHAKATQVTVSLKERDGKIKLTVKDNGKGITQEEIAHPKSYGLMGIRERAKILNGNSIIEGVHGKSTSVTVEILVHEKKKKESYFLNNTPSTTGVTK